MPPETPPLSRLLIATDAWAPQVNGVVQTLTALIAELRQRAIRVDVVSPDDFPSLPLPTYGDIRLALAGSRALDERLAQSRPDHVHIATEGPLGWAMRRACRARGVAFTTSFHTRFPEYLRQRAPVPVDLTYGVLRRFHGASAGTMVATESLRLELAARGFRNLMPWGRGVDLDRFTPDAEGRIGLEWPRPVFLYVGRLAPEKSVEDFLALKLPGTKVVVGDGPSAPALRQRYRQAVFLGARAHEELPAIYAQADVFVFPSRTDTFGLVLVEALACGTPVAAYPVPGPRDVIGGGGAGVLSADLRAAVMGALRVDREACRRHALGFTWRACADQFLANVERARKGTTGARQISSPTGVEAARRSMAEAGG